ncbi:MAG: hypothetical protein HC884_16135 [Chloroflexaceae bacterium]|nr:hypothetical protein [Chloroflexaceae bacterium]
MSQSLLSFDTDRIKSYVFASDLLREIRGASNLLDELNREKLPQLVLGDRAGEPGKTWYSAGGSGLFVVETAEVEEMIHRVQQAYAEQTGGAATITGVAVELPPVFQVQTDDIRPFWKLLGYRLKAAKTRNRDYQASVSHPLFRPGETDGSCYATDEDDEGQPISRASLLKSNRNRRLRDDREKRGKPLPEDFAEIARASIPQNYFALMVADGDSLGQTLEQCETLPEIVAFSRCMHQTLTEVVKQAAQNLAIQSRHHDVLLQAGDDLVVALPAHQALAFAKQVAEQFTAQMQQAARQDDTLPRFLADCPPTLSTAVVWSHVKFPFGAWRSIAESALAFTKQQRAARLQANPRATEPLINFLVVSSANHLEFKDYYNSVLVWKHETCYEQIVRTMRPYTVSGLQRLVACRQKTLRNIPRSKLEALRQAVFQPTYQQAMLDALRVLVHWRSETGKQAVQNLVSSSMEEMGASGNMLFPFIKTEAPDEFDEDEMMQTYRTPLADLAELWDFLPGGGEDAE